MTDLAEPTVSAEKLESYITRLEEIDAEARGWREDFNDLLKEAKGEGFNTKTIRKVLKLRRMKPHDRAEEEELLEMYKETLGMIP